MSDYVEMNQSFNIWMQDSDSKEEINRKIKEIILKNKNSSMTIGDAISMYFKEKVKSIIVLFVQSK